MHAGMCTENRIQDLRPYACLQVLWKSSVQGHTKAGRRQEEDLHRVQHHQDPLQIRQQDLVVDTQQEVRRHLQSDTQLHKMDTEALV